MDVRDVWFGTSIGAKILRILLLPLSGFYWIGWQAYLSMYRLGFKRSTKPHSPILVVGNFTVGGSGKSPAAIHLVEILLGKGRSVVVGCSGYGSPQSEGATIAPVGSLDAREWGDEPAMIRERFPEIPIVVGRDRVRAAELVQRSHPCAVLVMDDGLQHLPLAVDLRIALDPPLTNRWVLPAGPYREPPSARRADTVLPGEFTLVAEPLMFVFPSGQPVGVVVKGGQVGALAAIARPEAFRRDLEDAGLQVSKWVPLPDHADLSKGTILDAFDRDLPLVMTEKDWVKVRSRDDLGNRLIWIARRETSIEPAGAFSRWIDEHLP